MECNVKRSGLVTKHKRSRMGCLRIVGLGHKYYAERKIYAIESRSR
jgi:hypothetical protein